MCEGDFYAGVGSPIFDECYHMLTNFVHVIFEHCPRKDNTVAHELARIARYDNPSIWLDKPPGFNFVSCQ